MVRTLIKIVLTIAGNAIGLARCARAARRHVPRRRGFILAVLIFTVAELILEPLDREDRARSMPRRCGWSPSLVTTFLALLVTDLVSDGLEIEGALTWVLATVIVWLSTLLAGVILVGLFLKDVADDRR